MGVRRLEETPLQSPGMALKGVFLAEYLQPDKSSPLYLPPPLPRKDLGAFAIEQPQLDWGRLWRSVRPSPAGSDCELLSGDVVTKRDDTRVTSPAVTRGSVTRVTTPVAIRVTSSDAVTKASPPPASPATLSVTCSSTCSATCSAFLGACSSACSSSSRNLLEQLLLDIYKAGTRRLSSASSSATLTASSAMDSSSSDEDRAAPPLRQRSGAELRQLVLLLRDRVAATGARLGKHLRRRDQLRWRLERQQDIISAHLAAAGEGVAGGLRFSMTPAPGDSGFSQWLSAMQMVARLPGGIPPEFRRTLWLTLADKHLQRRGVDWTQAERLCFSEWSNPDDDELGVQIVKDLHRTGCSLFCGQSNQAVLKRVLLGYARWNKAVGYCQGFNMLAALILQVMDRNEPDSVKVMIYLIEGVLPESYFANNLRGLSVDMAVFRDLLRLRLPQLSRHLEHLQAGDNSGTSYEPPLTNVFTMQWFLTLFCNCLPQPTVLRVWDLIFLEGNPVLLRTALAIWDVLADRIMTVSSADEFYSIMGVLTREILEFNLMDSNRLIKTVVALQCPELPALRDKYMYNITPWTSTVSSGLRRGLRLFYTEEDSGDSGDNSEDDDSEKIAVAAAFGIADLFRSPRRRGSVNAGASSARGAGPGGAAGVGPLSVASAPGPPDRDRLSLDVSMLKQQYSRLRERQRQAQIILTAACGGAMGVAMGGTPLSGPAVAMNHLLLGKPALRSTKGRRLPPPPGAVPPRAPATPSQKRNSQPRPVETIHWKDEDQRRKSLVDVSVPEPRRRSASSDSSSSSTSTELCDEPGQPSEEEDHASPRLKQDLLQEGKAADLLQEDKVTDLLLEDKVPDIFVEDKSSDLLWEEKTTHIDQEDKIADLIQEDKVPNVIVEDKSPDLLWEDKITDLLQKDKVTDLLEDDKITDLLQDGKFLDLIQEDKSSDLLQEDKQASVLLQEKYQEAADPVWEHKSLYLLQDENSSDLLERSVPDLLQEYGVSESTEEAPRTSDQVDEPSHPRVQDLDLLQRVLEEDVPWRDAGQLQPPAETDLRRESPEQVVASVTEKLRLIMEHLEHGVQGPPSRTEDSAAASSSETLSSRESRQRLMDKLFGPDLGDLLDESKAGDELLERAWSAAGDVASSATGRQNKLDRQNSERASRIIRENSEILQRVWRGRSLTLPERSEPPDFLTSSPVKRNPPVLEEEADTFPPDPPRVGLSRTLSRERHCSKRYPDLPLPKQASLDESRTPDAAAAAARALPTEKLHLILEASVSPSEPTASLGKPRYKFPEMSPLNTSPLQPLPSVLRPPDEALSEGQPKKWRPHLSPPSTPVLPALPVQTPPLPASSSAASSTARRKKASTPDDGPACSPITFNPFPSRTTARQPKEIGVKLGLYPSSNLAKKSDRL